LRNYGVEGQIGLEPTPQAFVVRMVEVFAEVKRVLRNDGVCWLNIGDSYAGGGRGGGSEDCKQQTNVGSLIKAPKWSEAFRAGNPDKNGGVSNRDGLGSVRGLKAKDLCGMPWRVAFALQADGWWLRSDIIWSKPNPMPESVTDRPTKAHEYVFLLTKSERYHYDAEAISEPTEHVGLTWADRKALGEGPRRVIAQGGLSNIGGSHGRRNKRSVWTIATAPFPEAHFATFPPELPEICIKAGCPVGGTVLDPFSGAGTTAMVADRLGRNAIGIEISAEYVAITKKRLARDRIARGKATAVDQVEAKLEPTPIEALIGATE
jgi:DNA modification methylase